ncbi:hypothetical protein [Ideonella sp. A 288]|uniref:hypothetical protein n=1 Tax=Ideonella sp. A 288 TaxID=1962181 RepID=UPI000B4BF301|nr:hypothetical protein [Ideonella sp. A 288]
MSGSGVAAPGGAGGTPQAVAGAALRPRTAFVSPFTNSTNRYIDLHKQLLADSGYDVQPLNLRTLFSARAWGLLRPGNLITLHWLETRPFRHQGTQQALHLRGLLEFACYLLVLLLARAQRVYFVHDHAVHDTAGWQRRVSVALVGLLRWVADRRVVHDPACADRYRAEYLPHPLYWDAPGSTTGMPTAAPSVPPPAAAPAAAPSRPKRCGPTSASMRCWGSGRPACRCTSAAGPPRPMPHSCAR